MNTVASDQSWRTTEERRGVWGARLVLWLTFFGRGPARLLVRVIAFYYALFAGAPRRAMHKFLVRVEGASSFGRVYRQILRFAQVGLDSLFLMSGKMQHFEFTREGSAHLEELGKSKRGAILLSAHLGSMYAMRAQSGDRSLPIYAVSYTKHAERINAMLRELSPKNHAQLIEMGEGVDFMLRIKELVEDGAIIAIFADRVGSDDRAAEVDFFGAPARFPTGPYLLAAMLKCPVYLTLGLYRDPKGYDLICEPFAERIELPRGKRQEALEEYAKLYASRLEHYIERAPDNWFNFYDFWREASE